MKIVKNNKNKETKTLQEDKNLLSKKNQTQENDVEISKKEVKEVKTEAEEHKSQITCVSKIIVTKEVNFKEVNDIFMDASYKNNFYAIKEAEEVYDKMNGYSPIELKDIENVN